MSANAIAKRDEVITVTNEQLDLVKRTVAAGATDAELRLFLYDCERRGVHPLDRLLHFTKRGGKYVPIVSIDLMRSRAADTDEYAGNDDAEFEGIAKTDNFSARVTVYRLVQGQRCAFSATARWSEYCPPSGQDTMWKKMPHTMLAKVAESLALRKGFPQQIGGLYSGEEMAQAGEDERMGQAPPLRSPASADERCEATARQPVSGSQGQQRGDDVKTNRAKTIAAMGLVERDGEGFTVASPGVSKKESCRVWRDDDGHVQCSCEDYKRNNESIPRYRCEHIIAVKFFLGATEAPPASGFHFEGAVVAKTMADLVTPKQIVAIRAIANAAGLNAETICLDTCKCQVEELSRGAASAFIDHLKSKTAEAR